MKENRTIYIALMLLTALTSCVQESPDQGKSEKDGDRIYFRPHLPTVSRSRATVMSNDDLTECRVTCIIPEDNTLIDPDTGENTTYYFKNEIFAKDEDGLFTTKGEDPWMWPISKNRLHFHAFHPSVEEMREEIDKNGFNPVNYTGTEEATSDADYRIEDFRIAPSIADHVDFIAAYANATRQEGSSGIELNFGHQLARVELSAWSASVLYDVEIAGVRIGNALTKGDYRFTRPDGETSSWINTTRSAVEHIFGAGESIVRLSGKENIHETQGASASIMGNAGHAMVIPMAERIEAWEGKEDPNYQVTGYTTDKLYFSVLLRVIQTIDGEVVYPYADDRYHIPAIFLAVGSDGVVKERVYKKDGGYYTTPEGSEETKYSPAEGEEICSFCWAAIPVAAKWEAGKIYTYRLNYSKGIGWDDPYDPYPGEPIVSDKVALSVEVEDWKDGVKTGVTVPRK